MLPKSTAINLHIFMKYFNRGIFAFSQPYYENENKIQLSKYMNNESFFYSEEINCFVKTIYSDYYLDFEFFKKFDSLFVSVTDIMNNTVFKELINTDETFHLIINIENWTSGPYSIVMNNRNGLVIFGYFILNKK